MNRLNGNILLRLLIASIASILSVFITVFLIGCMILLFGEPKNYYDEVLVTLGFSFFASVYATGVLLVWGLPLHLILSIFRMRSIFYYSIIGALGGPILILLFRPFGVDSIGTTLYQIFIFYCFGVFSSIVFWFFAVHIQPQNAPPVLASGK